MAGCYKRLEYSLVERENILKYIIDNKQYYGLKGRALWMQMESEGVCSRSWQSMKEHFRSKIIPELNCFKIPIDERQKILAGFRGSKFHDVKKSIQVHYVFDHDEKQNDLDVKIRDKKQTTEKSLTKNRRLADFVHEHTFSSSSDEDLINDNSACKSHKEKRRRLSSSSNTSEQSFCLLDYQSHQPRVQKKQPEQKSQQKKNNLNQVLTESDSDSSILNTNILGNKNANQFAFKTEDDLRIIKYFKKNLTKLRQWKDLETYALMKSATGSMPFSPQSLRNRFMDHILPNLHKYSELSYDDMIDVYDNTGSEIPLDLQTEITKSTKKANKNVKEKALSQQNVPSGTNSANETGPSVASMDVARITPHTDEFLDCTSVELSEPEHPGDIQIYLRENEQFTTKEDLQIVEVFKRYKSFLKISSQQIFRLMAYVFQRTEKSLRDRFNNHIINNLTNFANLSTGDMIEFYLAAGNKAPSNLKLFFEQRCNMKLPDQKCDTNSCAVQATEEFWDLRLQDFVCIRHKGKKFAFISQEAKDIDGIKENLKKNADVNADCIHVVDAADYQIWKSLKQIEASCDSFMKDSVDNHLLHNKKIEIEIYEDISKYTADVLEPVLKMLKDNAISTKEGCSSSEYNKSETTNEATEPSLIELPTCAPISFSEDMIRRIHHPPSAKSSLDISVTNQTLPVNDRNEIGKGSNNSTRETLINLDNKLPDVTHTSELHRERVMTDYLNSRYGTRSTVCDSQSEIDIECVEYKPNFDEFSMVPIKTEQFDDSEDEEMPETSFHMQSVMLSRRASQMIKQERISTAHLVPKIPNEDDEPEEEKPVSLVKIEENATNSHKKIKVQDIANEEQSRSTNIRIVDENINGGKIRRVLIVHNQSENDNGSEDENNHVILEHNYFLN